MFSKINKRLRDTAITYYEYVGDRLDCEVKNDAAGMFSYCYIYNDSGMPVSRKYGRSERFQNLSEANGFTNESDITSENYSYAQYENQLHSTLFNASGRPYLKEIRYYDANTYLLKYSRSYVLSSNRYEEEYTYNERGWLAEKMVSDGKKPYTLKYSYDEAGNIIEENRYENDGLIYRKEYVYEGNTMRLTAELRRDEVENLIVITTYDYTNR